MELDTQGIPYLLHIQEANEVEAGPVEVEQGHTE